MTLFSITVQAQKDIDIPKHKIVIERGDQILKFEVQEDDKEVKAQADILYTWFSHHKIHTTRGDFNGDLLHGEFIIVNKERDLMEKGTFKYGQKNGIWKVWYADGEIKSLYKYKNGKKNGTCVDYDDMGDPVSKVKYVKGELHGKSIKYTEFEEPTIEKFKNGKLVEANEKPKKLKQGKEDKIGKKEKTKNKKESKSDKVIQDSSQQIETDK